MEAKGYEMSISSIPQAPTVAYTALVGVFVVASGLLITLHSKKIARIDQMESVCDKEKRDGEGLEAAQKDYTTSKTTSQTTTV